MIYGLNAVGIQVKTHVIDAFFYKENENKKVRAIFAYRTDIPVGEIIDGQDASSSYLYWYSLDNAVWKQFFKDVSGVNRMLPVGIAMVTDVDNGNVGVKTSFESPTPHGFRYYADKYIFYKTKFIVAELDEVNFFQVANNPQILETDATLGTILEEYYSDGLISASSSLESEFHKIYTLTFNYVFPYRVTKDKVIKVRVHGQKQVESFCSVPEYSVYHIAL